MPIFPPFPDAPTPTEVALPDPLIICTIDPVNDRGNLAGAYCGWEGGPGHGKLKLTKAAWDDPVPPFGRWNFGPSAPPPWRANTP